MTVEHDEHAGEKYRPGTASRRRRCQALPSLLLWWPGIVGISFRAGSAW